MTVPPSLSLEQALAQHGNVLYRVALLLGGDRDRAESALQEMARQVTASEQQLHDTVDLLRMLLPVLERQDGQRRRRRPARFAPDALVYGGPGAASPFDSLSFAERRTLGLYLLLGYDLATVAAISEVSDDEARTHVVAAMEGLARATGTSLPDATPTELCPAVRVAVMRAPEQLASDPMLRGHLALCGACRAFESAWGNLVRQTEAALRNALRPYTMPPELAATLVQKAQPAASLVKRAMAGGKLSFALLPLGVLLLIAALVLPGFWRTNDVSQTASAPLAEPRGMVQQALAQVTRPPEGKGVWHAQWETLWFFPDGKYAPLYADAWLDSYNPARHRLQLVHGAGGALYELEVGDGDAALWYALSPTYYSSLYGTNAGKPNAPQLVHRAMDAAAQQRAAAARLEAGAWDVGPSYLRQAYSAPDLHTLGRQTDGTHSVQIVSFTGISPLGLPPDDPQVTIKNVTVLLALDSADGRLRSVTELSGPTGGEQTSRVTWRLRSEEWLPNETTAREAFDAGRAWNGQGSFSSDVQGASADDELLLYNKSRRIAFERLLDGHMLVPAAPPPGTERAVLISFNDNSANNQWPPNASLTYLGQGRRMTLTWGEDRSQKATQMTSVSADKGQHLLVKAFGIANTATYSVMDVMIDASGYTHAEVQAVVQSIRPIDLDSWRAQQNLFPTIDAVDPQARAALVEALSHITKPGPGEAIHRIERHSMNRDSRADTLSDPYHLPRDGGWPQTIISEQWIHSANPAGTFASFTQVTGDDGQIRAKNYSDEHASWTYRTDKDSLERWNGSINDPNMWMSTEAAVALELLWRPGTGVKMTTNPDGMRVISRIEPLEDNSRYNWLANVGPDEQQLAFFTYTVPLPALPATRPLRILTELELTPTGEFHSLRYTGLSARGTVNDNKVALIEEWTLEQEQRLNLDAAPGELRNGAPPTDVAFVDDQSPNQSVGILRTATITEARALARSPLFVLPEASQWRLNEVINAGKGGVPVSQDTQNNVLQESVIRGLSLHLRYTQSQGSDSNGLSLFEGPATPLRAFLQSRPANWQHSEQRRITIAGREVDAWVMEQFAPAPEYMLIAEVDTTLLVIQGNDPEFATVLPLLASLQRAN